MIPYAEKGIHSPCHLAVLIALMELQVSRMLEELPSARPVQRACTHRNKNGSQANYDYSGAGAIPVSAPYSSNHTPSDQKL
jgi:hypothetical protein